MNDWYQLWQDSPYPHDELSQPELKDSMELQLEVIGNELLKGSKAAPPEKIWKVTGRLTPEERVEQKVPIEQVVQAYRLLVTAVRNWIEKNRLEVTFDEYSYFYEAFFELIAESVRRYVIYQAESVKRERSEYLAGLTHQMRTPLTALKAQIELIDFKQQIERPDIKRLQTAVSRLILLVNGVLRIERFRPEEIPVRKENLRVAELIDKIISEIEYEAIHKGLKLEVEVDRTLWMNIDPDLFWDCMGNLIHNAIKYTSKGFVRIEMDESEHDVTFKVRDSGPGIPQKRQIDLFKIQSPKAKDSMGLGLTVVNRAAAAQGGKVGVESRLGEGSLFWVRLPKKEAPKKKRPPRNRSGLR